MKHLEFYKRIGDMSPDDMIQLFMQEDGDILLSVTAKDRLEREMTATVEFCTVGAGGGRSSHTRKALMELAQAIERDNTECPIAKEQS